LNNHLLELASSHRAEAFNELTLELGRVKGDPKNFTRVGWGIVAREGKLRTSVLQSIPWAMIPEGERKKRVVVAETREEIEAWFRGTELEGLFLFLEGAFLRNKVVFYKFFSQAGLKPESWFKDKQSSGDLLYLPREESEGRERWPRYAAEMIGNHFLEKDDGSWENRHQRVYFWNTESSDDVNQLAEYAPLESFHLLAAGLKPYLILRKMAELPKARIKFVDNNPDSLRFFEWSKKQWDGLDYPEFLLWCTKRGINQYTAFGRETILDHRSRWATFLKDFGGIEAWETFWKSYLNTPVDFHLVDILNDTSALSRLAHGERHLTWTSNVFNTASTGALPLEVVAELELRALSYLGRVKAGVWLGENFFHQKFAGLFSKYKKLTLGDRLTFLS
jgi:hypothetical protein